MTKRLGSKRAKARVVIKQGVKLDDLHDVQDKPLRIPVDYLMVGESIVAKSYELIISATGVSLNMISKSTS